MKIFDTHAHIGLIDDDTISQLVIAQEASSSGVLAIINICNNLQDFEPLYKNLQRASNVYFAVGISPTEITRINTSWEIQIEQYAALDKVIAIGETGLDRKHGNKNQQVECFIKHIDIAEKLNYPIIIHNREAGQEIFDILTEVKPSVPIILHCFSENANYAKKIVEALPNTFISITGSVTYRTARDLRNVASSIPVEHILIESESPFMIPADLKGKRNKPAYITHTLKQIAKIREMEEEELAKIIYQNSCRAFKINP